MTTTPITPSVPRLGQPAFPQLQAMARRGSVQTAGAPLMRRPQLPTPNPDDMPPVAGVEWQDASSAGDPLQDSAEKELNQLADVDSGLVPNAAPVARTAPALRGAPRPGIFLKPLVAVPGQFAPASHSGSVTVSDSQVAGASSSPATPISLPVEMTRAAQQAAKQNESGQSFYEQVSRQTQSKQGMKEMASMRALSRLMEAVYQRPGGDAPVRERIAALQELVGEADAVAREMAKAFGYAEGAASQYVMAQAMESVVGLVSKAWERDESVNWAEMIAEAGVDPLIVGSAETMAHAVYKPVAQTGAGMQTAQERLAISLHNAFWEVYLLGEQWDDISPEVASQVVRSIAVHVQAQTKFNDLDLKVSWMQGSIKRLAGLFCAQMRSLDAAPTAQDIDRAVQLAKDGFDGVEFHASQLLEVCRIGGVGPQSVDAPTRPGGG